MFDLDVICEALSNVHPDKKANEQIANTDRLKFNCWGLTAGILGWTEKPYWVEREIMEKLIPSCSVTVSEPMVGDIAVFRDNFDELLSHTAVLTELVPEQKFIHKPGARYLEVLTREELEKCYGCFYGKIKEFRRSTVVKKNA
jgi:hypothetical protein